MNTRSSLFVALLSWTVLALSAQGLRSSQSYEELNDTQRHDSEATWNQKVKAPALSWASSNVHYAKWDVPQVKQSVSQKAVAWKSERVNVQALLWTPLDLQKVTLQFGDLKSGKNVIPASAVKASFVRYTLTDEYSNGKESGCTPRTIIAEWDSSLVGDVIDPIAALDVPARSVRPLWVQVWVPQSAGSGIYKGILTVQAQDMQPLKLNLSIEVKNRTLPLPADWKFHLDLWQNPYSVARYEGVPLWSKAHFDAMRPVMKLLADGGQKVITASIMYKPWNGQTYDYFSSMINHIKQADGSWTYDYKAFDAWVEFMMSVGIRKQINCYTMIPWSLTFDYFDQATNEVKFIKAKPGDPEYEAYWLPFLKDFATHLRSKGWFDITTIAMDERGLDAMKEAIKVIRKADAAWKISLAGNFHQEIQAELYDLCLGYGSNFPPEVKAERAQKGQVSTYYTCCSTELPNEFTFSQPSEAVWAMWHAAAWNYDGFLRWAYNSWPEDPLRDSRYFRFQAGDCFIAYPGDKSSVRMEKMIEGIQDYEKIRILKEEFSSKGNQKMLKKLNDVVNAFSYDKVTNENAEPMVVHAQKILNEF